MADDVTLDASIEFGGFEESQTGFTELGQAVSTLRETMSDFKDIVGTLSESLTGAVTAQQEMHAANALGAQDTQKAIEDTRELTKEHEKLGDELEKQAKSGKKALAAAGASVKGVASKAGAAVSSQVSGIRQGIMSKIRGLPVGGGLFGLMMWGVLERDRLAREAGELGNIIVAGGGTAAGKLGRIQTGMLRSFQETAQHYFGIAKGETQGVLKTFVDMGVGAEEAIGKINKGFKVTTESAFIMSMAIDKTWELATGTAAKTSVQIAQDYSQTIKEATKLTRDLALEAASSQMGVANFMQTIMQTGTQLRMYGVRLENILQLYRNIRGTLPEGLSGPAAAQQTALVLGQLAGGMAGLGVGMQMMLGERMGMGTGLEARQRFRGGVARMATGEGGDFLTRSIKEITAFAMEATGGGRREARELLEQQGFGFEGAKVMMDMSEKMDEGKEIDKKDRTRLRKAFQTEGQKQSRLLTVMRGILDGMAKVGQGIFKILTGFIGTAVVFFDKLPIILAGMLPGAEDWEVVASRLAMGTVGDVAGVVKEGFADVFTGIKGIGKSGKPLLKAMGVPVDRISAALDRDVELEGRRAYGPAGSPSRSIQAHAERLLSTDPAKARRLLQLAKEVAAREKRQAEDRSKRVEDQQKAEGKLTDIVIGGPPRSSKGQLDPSGKIRWYLELDPEQLNTSQQLAAARAAGSQR